MKDPRAHNVVHSLESIVFIAIAATICEADNWEESLNLVCFGKID